MDKVADIVKWIIYRSERGRKFDFEKGLGFLLGGKLRPWGILTPQRLTFDTPYPTSRNFEQRRCMISTSISKRLFQLSLIVRASRSYNIHIHPPPPFLPSDSPSLHPERDDGPRHQHRNHAHCNRRYEHCIDTVINHRLSRIFILKPFFILALQCEDEGLRRMDLRWP
jgi:hypothetical protein